MDESKEQQKIYGFFQFLLYFLVLLDIYMIIYQEYGLLGSANLIFERLSGLLIFTQPFFAKLSTLILICLIGVGTKAQKNPKASSRTFVVLPLAFGLCLLFGSLTFLKYRSSPDLNAILPYTNGYELGYIVASVLGAILTMVSIDNISKFIKSNLGKDKWNIEQESFMQDTKPLNTPTSVSIPMQFYYKGKVHKGFININPFRGVAVVGTPGSGKSFGLINPMIRQMISKDFTMCLYDFKFPDLGKIAYYHYLLAQQQGRMLDYKFHVINLNDVTRSCRVNPLHTDYIKTLADAQEISTALVEALKKGDTGGGSDQFFTQSAINFLASAVYFLAKHENGRYSSMPHLMAFLNLSYEDVFTAMLLNPELNSLLSPFMSAHSRKAYDQLEGQVGTLKIFISRLASKESFWVFSKNDFSLKISDRANPSLLVLANDPSTQDINSALYALTVNRIVSLINSKGNHPTAIIADEAPTLYIHKVQNVIATARSNKVSVVLGLQELPQLKQQYGDKTADSVMSTIANIISGSVRSKQTLEWLQMMLGKVKQQGESMSIDRNKTSITMNERLDTLIPAGKIASLKTSEVVGLLAKDVDETKKFTGEYETSAIHCKISLDMDEIKVEESNYPEMPVYYDFKGREHTVLMKNYNRITEEIAEMVHKIRIGEHHVN